MGDRTLWSNAHDKLHGLKRKKIQQAIKKEQLKKLMYFHVCPQLFYEVIIQLMTQFLFFYVCALPKINKW
jgi:hypothetical protein